MSWLEALRRWKRPHLSEGDARSREALDRELSAAEAEFVCWLLENGGERAKEFLPQLDRARVVGHCTCGCASIDFAIEGISHYPGSGLEVLAEYRWESSTGPFGVFIFACEDLLAGIDLYSYAGEYPASYLPATILLKGLDEPAA